MDIRRNFSRGGNVYILLLFVRLLMTQCKRKFTKRFTASTRLQHKENAPCYDNSHKKCVSLAAIAKCSYTIIFTIGYLQNFKAGYFFSEKYCYDL